jgi:DnaJ-class molecular chaperone
MHEVPESEYIDDEHGITDNTIPFQINCAFCNGTGVHPGTMKSLNHSHCPVCQGEGIIHFHTGRENYRTCPECEGSGRQPGQTPPEPCTTCGGCGITES